MVVNETYSAKALAASGAILGTNGGVLGGFFCTTAGTLQLNEGIAGAGALVVASFAVAVGVFYTLPFNFPPGVACYATLAGGAAGTFAVN